MKKIYKSLMALAAAMLLPLSLTAQTPDREKYEFDAVKGIGYNKYLLSDTPNDDGEYMLRIENFITGNVKATAVPTDFVLVLDVSGSMQWDYKPRDKGIPQFIRKSEDENRDPKSYLKLRLDDGQDRGYNHYRYTGYVSDGTVGEAGTGGYANCIWAQAGKNPSNSSGYSSRFYYYPEDETYYRLFRYSETIDGNTCYYIYFDRVDADGNRIAGERYYVVQGTNGIEITKTKPTNIHGEKIIIFIDNYNNSGYKLYRTESRKDALKNGVNAFIDMIKAENEKDQWAEGVTKHQVAVVPFGSYKKITSSDLNEPAEGTAQDGLTKVSRIFREINASNADSYKNWDNFCNWQGGTIPYAGTTGAKLLFQQLQAKPNMAPLNGAGGTNRAKVMVFFTDGEANQATGVSGYSNVRGSLNLTCQDGAIIKKTGKIDATGQYTADNQQINGLIYTINLSNNKDYVPDFMNNLSSNNPIGTVNNGTSGGGKNTTYDGTVTDNGYYMDANDIDLETAFKAIAAANTGAMSTTLVAVDVVSDSFQIPFTTTDTEKVTMYTAECIGYKDIDGNGEFNMDGGDYLAFAEPIVVDERRGLQHLWVVRDGQWRDLGDGGRIDIDDDVTFKVTDDGKSIIVSGFNYADLWCGEDKFHENSRQMADTDPNAAHAKPFYRGFKLIFDFPITLDPDALGGVNVPTNDPSSGLYKADADGNPTSQEVVYPEPDLPVPVKLIIQKTGLLNGESANFTVQRKLRTDSSAEYEDFTTFVLTGGVSIPEVRIINLDPAYYYKVKEGNWSWAYEAVHPEYSTETPGLKNPIVFENNPEDDTPKHAEAKATNVMKKTASYTIPGEND